MLQNKMVNDLFYYLYLKKAYYLNFVYLVYYQI